MRLYQYISNEAGTSKGQGGQSLLLWDIRHQIPGKKWNEPGGSEVITGRIEWNDGAPGIVLNIPESWEIIPPGSHTIQAHYIGSDRIGSDQG